MGPVLQIMPPPARVSHWARRDDGGIVVEAIDLCVLFQGGVVGLAAFDSKGDLFDVTEHPDFLAVGETMAKTIADAKRAISEKGK